MLCLTLRGWAGFPLVQRHCCNEVLLISDLWLFRASTLSTQVLATQAANASGTCTWHLAASLAGQLHYLPLLGVAPSSGMGMRPGPGVEAAPWPLSPCVPTRTRIIDGMIWIEEPEPGPEAGFPASRRFMTLRHSSRNRNPNESLST
jgi:hypothetical protein